MNSNITGSQMLEARPAANRPSGQSKAEPVSAPSHQPEGHNAPLSPVQPAQREPATQRQARRQHATGPELTPAQPAAELPRAAGQAAARRGDVALAGFSHPAEQPGPHKEQPQHAAVGTGQGEGSDSLAQPLEDRRSIPQDEEAQPAHAEPHPSASISKAVEHALPQPAADPEQVAQLLASTMRPDQEPLHRRQAASEPEHEQRVLMPRSTRVEDRLSGASGQLGKQAARPGGQAEADSKPAASPAARHQSSAQRMPSQVDAASHPQDQAQAAAELQPSLPQAQQLQHEERTAQGTDQVTLLLQCGCPHLEPYRDWHTRCLELASG